MIGRIRTQHGGVITDEYNPPLEVVFTGCSEWQWNYGGDHDPKELVIGQVYHCAKVLIYSSRTTVHLTEFSGLNYNSVCFENPDGTIFEPQSDLWDYERQ